MFRLVLLLIAVASASSSATLQLAPSFHSVMIGEFIHINVNVSSITDLYAYQFDLAYSPTRLRAVSISEGSFLSTASPTVFVPGTINDTNGLIEFTANSLQGLVSGASGSGTLASMVFEAIEIGGTQMRVTNGIFIDSDLSLIELSDAYGIVNVRSPEPAYGVLLGLAGSAILVVGRRRTS